MRFRACSQRKRKTQSNRTWSEENSFEDEASKLIDADELAAEGIHQVEQMGMIFIDEIDKIASKEGGGNAQVSREGVQRDILPIVEGRKFLLNMVQSTRSTFYLSQQGLSICLNQAI